MQLLIENLVKLQAIELDVSGFCSRRAPCRARSRQPRRCWQPPRKRVADNSAALSREESLHTHGPRNRIQPSQKAARFRVQLDSVTTTDQAQAMEHEIQFATSEAERLENEGVCQPGTNGRRHGNRLCRGSRQVESLAASLETV